jgi:hypothetical protein
VLSCAVLCCALVCFVLGSLMLSIFIVRPFSHPFSFSLPSLPLSSHFVSHPITLHLPTFSPLPLISPLPPSPPGETDYTMHVGLKMGCEVTNIVDEVRQGTPHHTHHTSHIPYATSYPATSYHITSYPATSCHITSYHITSYHITSYPATSYPATSCHATSYPATSCHATSYHATSHHITSYHATSHHITSYHATSYPATSYHATSCHATSYLATYHTIPHETEERKRQIEIREALLMTSWLMCNFYLLSRICRQAHAASIRAYGRRDEGEHRCL